MATLLLRSPIIAAAIIAVVALSTATTSAARPCRTFLISSYTIRNPSTNTFATVTEIRSLNNPLFFINNNNNNHHHHHPNDLNDAVFASSHSHNHNHHDLQRASRPRAPLGLYASYDFTSLRDRTKDILSVVLALLFGFGCGSLAAAAMYLLCSVFSGRRDRRYDDFSDDFSDDDGAEIESPKKFGYVKIPAAEAAAAKDSSSV